MEDHVNNTSRRRYFSSSDVRREAKEWGEEQWIVNKEYCGKKLLVRKGRRSSMHTHHRKDEVLLLDSGSILFELNEATVTLAPGDFVHVRPGARHRFTALEDSVLTEFSTTHYDEDSHRTEPSGHAEPDRWERQRAILSEFERIAALVVGDVMLDTFLTGAVERISPEAPVPVVRLEASDDAAGGAGNVARNAAALGARTTVIAVCGNDLEGDALIQLLTEGGVDPLVQRVDGRPTTHKTRITSSRGQQLLRMDVEVTTDLEPAHQDLLLELVRERIREYDVLLLSDYAKGVISPSVVKECIGAAREAGVPVVLAPKPQGDGYLAAARGVSVLVANRSEAQALIADGDHSAPELARKLAQWCDGGAIVTLAESGIAVAADDDLLIRPALSTAAVDVSGAGDTVAATVAVALAAGASVVDAADMANRAAAVVVTKRGTAVVDRDELRRML